MNPLKKKIITFLILYPLISFGQNFVPNPSFEDFNSFPCSYTGTQYSFSSYITDWTVPSQGTSDLYSLNCDHNCFAYPLSANGAGFPGLRSPRTGNSFAGIYTYGSGGNPSGLNYREYLQVKLSQPLVIGQTYYAEFYCSRATSQIGANNLSMYFSDSFIDTATVRNLNFTPDIIETSIIEDATNWQKVSGEFIATNNAQYLIIGNFKYDSNTNHDVIYYASHAYYYIDDVCVSNDSIGCMVNCSSSSGTDVITSCNPYTWIDGHTYTFSNHTAIYALTNAANCDSIVTLDLTINNSIVGTDVITACNSYTWIDGNTYTSSTNTPTFNIVGGSANGCDSLVTLDLTINNSSVGTDVITACNSYTWIDGNTYTSSTNTPTFNIVGGGANGCDSLVTLDLTINKVSDVSISHNGLTITANNNNANYQWLNCDSSNVIINGETNKTITVSKNGNYAVELTENGCVDTSACINISTVGLVENNFSSKLIVYPNPSDGAFTVDLGESYKSVNVKITDINGKTVEIKEYHNTHTFELNIDEPTGVYLLIIESAQNKAIIRVVKD